MRLRHLNDPFGPGSVPWNAFDRALDAARNGRLKSYPTKRGSYPQYKADMVNALRKRGAIPLEIKAWVDLLDSRVANEDFDT